MTSSVDTHHLTPASLAARVFTLMAAGSLEDFQQVIHPDAVNREAAIQPLAARGTGPQAWHETALWLRNLADDVQWQITESVATEDLVAVFCTMSGHHTGEHTHYDAKGDPARVMPPTGKPFATTQSHWFRIAAARVIEHWANRDDLGIAIQLGWFAAPVRQCGRSQDYGKDGMRLGAPPDERDPPRLSLGSSSSDAQRAKPADVRDQPPALPSRLPPP